MDRDKILEEMKNGLAYYKRVLSCVKELYLISGEEWNDIFDETKKRKDKLENRIKELENE